MDPLTSALNLSTLIVALITRVWDATPEQQKATSASDVAKTLHNCSAFVQAIQERINVVVTK